MRQWREAGSEKEPSNEGVDKVFTFISHCMKELFLTQLFHHRCSARSHTWKDHVCDFSILLYKAKIWL